MKQDAEIAPTNSAYTASRPGVEPKARRRWRRMVSYLLSAALVIAAGVAIVWVMDVAPPQASAPEVIPAPIVDVRAFHIEDAPLRVSGFGSIVAAREVVIRSQIDGLVVDVSDAATLGGVVEAGDVLFRIEPRDYELSVAQVRAVVTRAQAALAMQSARSDLARREWEEWVSSARRSGGKPDNPLASLEPQRQQAQADLEAAESLLAAAELALERTVVRAPFGGVVTNENIEVGGRVDTTGELISLVGDHEFHVIATVPLNALMRLQDAAGQRVDVMVNPGSVTAIRRVGRFVRTLPDVEDQGRLGRVLIAIADPLGLTTDVPPLVLGSYAQVVIDAGAIHGVTRIPPEALRENGQVWVRDANGLLQYRGVTVAWQGPGEAYVRVRTEPGDLLITSYLNEPPPGQPVRVREGASDEQP